MQAIRKTFVGIFASLLFSTLLIFGICFGIQQVFSTPDSLKGALKDSGFYNGAIKDGLSQAQKEQQKEPNQSGEAKDEIPLDQPGVQEVIQNAASPAFLQTQTEKSLDAVYSWLQGKTPTLDFAVDLQDVKTRLADGLSTYVQQHLTSLPACASGASQNDIDPFNATCVPQGTNISEVAAKAKDQVTQGDFLKDVQLTASSIKTSDGKTLEEKLQKVPDIYKTVNWTIYAAGLLAILLALAVILLSSTRRAGLKRVAIIAIVVGAIVTILGWLTSFAMQRASQAMTESDALQERALSIAKLLAQDIRGWWMGYGIMLLVLGIGTLIALHFIKSKGGRPAPVAPTQEDTPSPSLPAAEQPTTNKEATELPTQRPAKPRPTRRLVQ